MRAGEVGYAQGGGHIGAFEQWWAPDVSLPSDIFRVPGASVTEASGQGTNPLARESAARGAEQVARVALTN
jgi:hypothetical protein